MKALLELDQVRLIGPNGDRLKSITLRLWKGERIALLGRSGAGKSSLIAIANGSLLPAEGRVLFQGEPLEQLTRRQRALIGTLWQDLRLVEELSIAQNAVSYTHLTLPTTVRV